MGYRLRNLICFFLFILLLASFNGCSSNHFIQKLWETKVYESEGEENTFPLKVIPDIGNNKVYANYASKLLCIDISHGNKIWELNSGEDRLIFDFMFDDSNFFISLIPKQYSENELFTSNIAKIDAQTGKYIWKKEFSKSYSPVFLFFLAKDELMVAREGKCYILNCLNGEIMHEYRFPIVADYGEEAISSWTLSNEVFYKYLPVSKEIIRVKLSDFSNFKENLRFKNIVLPDDLSLSLVRDGKILLTSPHCLILGSEGNGEIIKNIKFEDISAEFSHHFINLNNNYINPTIYKDYILGKYFSINEKSEELGFLVLNFEDSAFIRKKHGGKLSEIAMKAKFSPFIWKETLFLIYEERDKDRSTLLAYSFPNLEPLFTIGENTKFLKKRVSNETNFSNPPYLFASVEKNNIIGLIVAYSDRIIFYTLNR